MENGVDGMEEKIRLELKKVFDPELNLNVVDLGLVYEVKFENNVAWVKMTFTSPACPVGPMILSSVKETIKKMPGVKDAQVQVTFNPPWSPERASDEIKAMFEQLM